LADRDDLLAAVLERVTGLEKHGRDNAPVERIKTSTSFNQRDRKVFSIAANEELGAQVRDAPVADRHFKGTAAVVNDIEERFALIEPGFAAVVVGDDLKPRIGVQLNFRAVSETYSLTFADHRCDRADFGMPKIGRQSH